MDGESSQIDVKTTFQDDAIHQKWEAAYRNNRLLDKLNDAIFARFMKRIQPTTDAVVLDAGCGIGDHALRFARFGCRTTGIDLSETMITKARERAEVEVPDNQPEYHVLGIGEIASLHRQFDLIHCRGVLMHIRDWKSAVRHLCKCLKPNGHLVIIENNHQSCEARIVRAVRMVRRNSRHMISNEEGLEFHDSKDGYVPLTRIANIRALRHQLQENGIATIDRFSSQFFDLNRFPAGSVRHLALLWNRVLFNVRCPAPLGCENVIIGRKSLLS